MSESLHQKLHSLKEAAQLTSADISTLSDKILTQVVIETIRTYQQKLAVGIEDSVSDLLAAFKENTANAIMDVASGWQTTQQEGFLLPKDCRFCFRRGDHTVIVIEQQPQVRNLYFSWGMQESGRPERIEQTEQVSLAMPYVIFVFHFNKNIFQSVRCSFRNRPLTSLRDNLDVSPLPNIHVGGKVCLAYNYSAEKPISLVCHEIISSFWTSQFNTDLSDEWFSKHRISDLIATGKEWQRNTLRDPLFILQVEFQARQSLKDTIEMSVQEATDLPSFDLRHRITEEIDECAENLFHKIQSYMKKTKFDRHVPKDIGDVVKEKAFNAVSEMLRMISSIGNGVTIVEKQLSPKRLTRCQAGEMWREIGR